MSKINLARAFTLRKRLRSVVNEIGDKLGNASVFIHVSTEYPDEQVIETNIKPFGYKGLDLMGTYKLYVEANKKMVQLNNLIDCANVPVARSKINELESQKSFVGILNNFAEENKTFVEKSSKYETFIDSSIRETKGGIVTKNFKKICDYDWEQEADNCRKRIVQLEDELSDINATTVIDVPDDLIKFIEKNI